MTAAEQPTAPEPCPDRRHGAGPHWHATFTNRDGASRYATTRDPARMQTPHGWTFLGWGRM